MENPYDIMLVLKKEDTYNDYTYWLHHMISNMQKRHRHDQKERKLKAVFVSGGEILDNFSYLIVFLISYVEHTFV